MHTQKIKQQIKHVLDSDVTDYRLSVMLGDKSSTYVRRLRDGRSEIDNMPMYKVKKFEEIYHELIEGEHRE